MKAYVKSLVLILGVCVFWSCTNPAGDGEPFTSPSVDIQGRFDYTPSGGWWSGAY
jgi:hypothetical protein